VNITILYPSPGKKIATFVEELPPTVEAIWQPACLALSLPGDGWARSVVLSGGGETTIDIRGESPQEILDRIDAERVTPPSDVLVEMARKSPPPKNGGTRISTAAERHQGSMSGGCMGAYVIRSNSGTKLKEIIEKVNRFLGTGNGSN
jgi:hypothetical protein